MLASPRCLQFLILGLCLALGVVQSAPTLNSSKKEEIDDTIFTSVDGQQEEYEEDTLTEVEESELDDELFDLYNGTALNDTSKKNLIVIKSVVYEVGFLTEADSNETSASNETEEEVDLSFFNPDHNQTTINLSNIPIPIQTNISGETVTGIIPADFGIIKLGPNGVALLNESSLPLFPNRQIVVKHNLNTSNKEHNKAILENLGDLLGIDDSRKDENDNKKS